MTDLGAPPLGAVRAAAGRLAGAVLRTPLLRLETDGPEELWLKPEGLQPIGSFKVRGAGNAMLLAGAEALGGGVITASAGNMAQGVAWWARRMGVPAAAVVPEGAPGAKLEAIARLGARVVPVPFERWWGLLTGEVAPPEGRFVHPVADPDVIAGNGTIGLEILEDLPAVKTILVPFGGGGLSTGIAAAVRALDRGVRVIGCEVETATPLAASLRAGAPRKVDRRPSFVDGIGGRSLLPAMWPLVRTLLAGAAVVSVEQVAAAIRLVAARAGLVAEGAGAAAVAAALAGHARGPTVCVVSGGNIQPSTLAAILGGEVPPA